MTPIILSSRPFSIALAACLLTLAPLTTFADRLVPYDDPLIPVGLRPGDSFHLVFTTGTDPHKPDTDGDSLLDGVETGTGKFVDASNTGTNPLKPDTDGDQAGDWYEVTASFTDPNDAAENPGVPYPLPDPDPALTPAADKPVKVFILSGQSNMVGIGYVQGPKPGSLDVITRQDGKFPNLIDDEGNYLERKDVWYEGVVTATARKWLAPGCGGDDTRIGPELGFGHLMGWHHDEPVIILKASQGNRSLGWDILPPGSPRFEFEGMTHAGYGDSPSKWDPGSEKPAPGGWYAGKEFNQFFMDEKEWVRPDEKPIRNAVDVLDNFDTIFPQWADQGFQIAGYAWFQGHKDQEDALASRYEQNLKQLIEQLRAYFENRYPDNTPAKAPFAVATIGFDGKPFEAGSPPALIHAAQLAVSDPEKHPAFAGNVKSVDTLPFWREVEKSPGGQGFHYNNNAETYLLIGDALGRAMLDMLRGTGGE